MRNPTSKSRARTSPQLRLSTPILLAPIPKKAKLRESSHPRYATAGQSLVEFALIVPLILLLLIGAIEIGRVAYYAIAVTNASRAAVQYGAQKYATAYDTTGIKQAAVDDFGFGSPMLSLDNVTKSFFYTWEDGSPADCENIDCNGTGNRFIPYLKVTTQLQLTPLIGFPGVPESFVLKGEANMRIGN
jgi:hypothetical protein